MIARNHTGHRVGECHHRANLSDKQVRMMRHEREHTKPRPTLRQLATKYNCGLSTARDICSYWTRASA